MPKTRKRKARHVPQRTCVGCRTTSPKREMIRLVAGPQAVLIDPSGKLAGRGAYLHDRRSCWERGLKSSLSQALKIELTADDQERLRAFVDSLPDETSVAGGEADGQG